VQHGAASYDGCGVKLDILAGQVAPGEFGEVIMIKKDRPGTRNEALPLPVLCLSCNLFAARRQHAGSFRSFPHTWNVTIDAQVRCLPGLRRSPVASRTAPSQSGADAFSEAAACGRSRGGRGLSPQHRRAIRKARRACSSEPDTSIGGRSSVQGHEHVGYNHHLLIT
jgi:hypothetical protein